MTKAGILISLLAVLLSACNLAAPGPAAAVDPGATLVAQAPTPSAPPASGAGDIIFHNGVVLTMDELQPTAEAVLVNGETIRAVGTDDEILKMRGGQTEVIDLGGLTLMPGFVDTHSHLFLHTMLSGGDPAPDLQLALQYGVTTMTEMGVDQTQLEMLKAYADTGDLRIRLSTYLTLTNNCGEPLGDWWKAHAPNQLVAPNLTVRGVKLFTDGGACKIPAVSVEYPGGGMGDLFFTQEQLNATVADVQGAGFQAAIHALGDRAVEETQNAIAAVLNGQPNSLRHRIEHNGIVRPDMMARYSEVGIVPVIPGAYATCVRTANSGRYKYILAEIYTPWEWPWRGLLDANPGLPVAWHADYGPLDYLNPFYVLWGFVTRNEVNKEGGSICEAPAGLKQGAIRVDEALPIMTTGSAYALFMEDEVGSLEPGKLADLIIVSENPLTASTESLKDIFVHMTMIGGKVEYCAGGSEVVCPKGTPSGAAPPAAAPGGPVTASAELPEAPATNARDGDLETIWNSGSGPEQWIILNLGSPQAVSSIRLTISQYPGGQTLHQVWAGSDPGNLTIVHVFSGTTSDGGVLDFFPPNPLTGVQYIQIVTKASPSWVAWREIEIR